ncbi:hypothetical protein L7F22_067628 [Adiantum nelumboides]|nr:hypothetical protein [Adiantum nelumboides]
MQQASSCLLGAASAPSTFYRAQILEDDYCAFESGQQPLFQQKKQLDVLPISAYYWDCSFPQGPGKLIAVNCSYVCYCLRSSGGIRILGRNAPFRGLFQGHTQRVTDLEFFAEDENLVASVSLDARLFVWRIVDVGGKDDFQLQQHVLLDITFEGSWKDVCPRVCWHPQSKEILMVSFSNHIFKIDLGKAQSAASQLKLSEKASLSCFVTNLIDGISCIGQHDFEVTDLSIFIEDVLYIASASSDGMVRIWEDCNKNPLAVLRPHDGQPVGSVFFLTCDSQPDRVALLTSDMLAAEEQPKVEELDEILVPEHVLEHKKVARRCLVKFKNYPSMDAKWMEEGELAESSKDSTNKNLRLWVPTAPSCRFSTWCLVQTLEFRSCDGMFAERLFSSRICTLPQAGLLLLGCLELPSLFSVYPKFGGALNEVRMKYLTEFSLSMPILSLTAAVDVESSIAHIFCVQTQAIQEYCLNISEFLIPQCDEPVLVSNSEEFFEAELKKISVCKTVEGELWSKRSDMPAKEMVEFAVGTSNSGSGFGSWVEVPNWIAAAVKRNLKNGSLLASGNGGGSVESLMENQQLLSIRADNISASLSPLPSLTSLLTSSGSSKMTMTALLPVEFNALSSGLNTGSWKHDVTASDSENKKQLLMVSHDHQESEPRRGEEPPMILQGNMIISCLEVAADGDGVDTCSGVQLEHFKGWTENANAAGDMEAIKDGLLSAVKGNPREHQEELNPPYLENAQNKPRKKRRRRKKGAKTRVTKGTNKEHQEELCLPELESSSNILKRKMNRRRRGLGFRIAKTKHKEHQKELNLPVFKFPSNNIKGKRTRSRKRSSKESKGITGFFLPHSATQILQDACQPPSTNREDLSERLNAIRESVDELLLSQRELQHNLFTVTDIPGYHEIDVTDGFQEEWIDDCLISHWDTSWRQITEKANQNMLQFEWTEQLQKSFDDFFSKDSLFPPTSMLTTKVLSCIESNIDMPISLSVEKGLITSLPRILEAWDEGFSRVVEKLLDKILDASLREQMETVLSGLKHLIQEEMFCKQAVLKVDQTCEDMRQYGHCLSVDGILQQMCVMEHCFDYHTSLLSRLKDTLLTISCTADSLNEELNATKKCLKKTTEHFPANDNFVKEITLLLQQGQLEDAFAMALSLQNSFVTSWICKQADLRTLFARGSPPLSQGVILLLLQQLAVGVGHESSDTLAWMEGACLALVPNDHPNLCMRFSLEQVYMLLQQQSHLFTTNVKLANQARLVMHLLNSLMAFCS